MQSTSDYRVYRRYQAGVTKIGAAVSSRGSASYEAVVSSPRGSHRRGVLLASVNYVRFCIYTENRRRSGPGNWYLSRRARALRRIRRWCILNVIHPRRRLNRGTPATLPRLRFCLYKSATGNTIAMAPSWCPRLMKYARAAASLEKIPPAVEIAFSALGVNKI